MNTTNLFIANLIYIFHLGVVLFILFSPLFNEPSILILHIAFSFTILVHWIANNNICALSLFESKLRGIPYTQSFSHMLIGPIYDISNTTLCYISYIVVILLLIYSIYILINHDKWIKAKQCNCNNFFEYISCFLGHLI